MLVHLEDTIEAGEPRKRRVNHLEGVEFGLRRVRWRKFTDYDRVAAVVHNREAMVATKS